MSRPAIGGFASPAAAPATSTSAAKRTKHRIPICFGRSPTGKPEGRLLEGVSMGELVADYLLERLRQWGIHRIYGYPGDGINAVLGALDRADGDPEFIQVR